jgi:hypothetical protein
MIYVDELLILTSVHCWTLCVNDGFDCNIVLVHENYFCPNLFVD